MHSRRFEQWGRAAPDVGVRRGSWVHTVGSMATTAQGCNDACSYANSMYKSTGLGADAGCTFH
jgi:hypothetical protein